MKYLQESDIVIIGAGIAGLASARELSKYDTKVLVIEKEVDVAWGSTKANMGVVCQGGDGLTFRPGMLKTEIFLLLKVF